MRENREMQVESSVQEVLGSRMLRLCLGLGLVVIAMVIAPSAKAGNKALLNSFATKSGEGAGHVGFGTGVAVDRAGNGGVSPGDVYVSNFQNARVEEFSAGGAFVRAFGWDVVASGADDSGGNEQQAVTVPAAVTAGTFKLNVTTATALGSTTTGSNVLTLASGGLGAFRIGGPISGGTIPAGTTVTAISATEEKLTLSAAPSSTAVNVALSAIEQTASINFNAPASGAGSVQEALEALPGVGASGVAVTGGPGGTAPYVVAFSGGNLAHDDVPQMTVVNALTGGTATVATQTPGGGPEVCNALSSPSDQCKAGSKITGAGAINAPEGIGLSQATGNVFVASNGNKRIDVFSAKGVFEGAFGWKVKAGAEEAAQLQFCTTAGTGCKAGEANAGAGGFSNLTQAALAVDPVSGDLYVGERGNLRINEFSFALNGLGEVTGVSFVRAFGWDVIPGGTTELESCTTGTTCKAGVAGGGNGQFSTSTPTGIAVDSGGFVYAVTSSGTCNATTNPCRIQKFNPDGTFKEAFGPASGNCQLQYTSGAANAEAAGGVAVDPSDQHLFVTRKADSSHFELCEFDSSGALLDRSPAATLTTNSTGYLQPALGTAERAYLNAPIAGQVGAVYLLGPVPPPPLECLAPSELSATGVRLNGKVTVPAPGGDGFEPRYRFEYSGDNGLTWTRTPVPDAALGTSTPGAVSVSAQVVELIPGTTYRWRLVAATSSSNSCEGANFTTAAARPLVAHSQALPIGDTTATLRADVNPESSGTTYRFQWGKTIAYGSQAPAFEPFIGSGHQAVPASAELGGLQPGTDYHFRVLATNASGTTAGPDTAFTTHPCPYQDAAGLPDCRQFELVSPADKGPLGDAGQNVGLGVELPWQVAPDGESAVYVTSYGFPDTTKGGEALYRSERSSDGWQAFQFSPAASEQVGSKGNGNFGSRIVWLSDGQDCAFLVSSANLTDDPAAVPAIDAGGVNLYRRDADDGYTLVSNLPITNESFIDPNPFEQTFMVAGASEDCSRVVFESKYRYEGVGYNEALAHGTLAHGSMYEWNEGTLRNAGLIPSAGGPQEVPALPGLDGISTSGGDFRNSVSGDGVFFTATSQQGGDAAHRAVFFLRSGDAEAVDVSQSQTGVANNGDSTYQIASEDGSQAFFLARYGLAANGTSTGAAACNAETGAGCDLYRYSVGSGALIDLSADSNPADTAGAGVVGVLDSSRDGSRVYLAAQGRLVPEEGKSYAENTAGSGSYNLYLARVSGGSVSRSFVATISADDLFSGSALNVGLLAGVVAGSAEKRENAWRSQTAPDGEHLLFVSTSNLTGYDSGGVAEAYLYSAGAGTTICLSCRADGQPSVGAAGAGGTSPLVEVGLGDHRPVLISEDGREVFFKMRDVLAPGAREGDENLYEWHDGQISFLSGDIPGTAGLARSAFLGASSDGSSIFFRSERALVPQDTDERQDVYVARAGGGFAPPLSPPTPCDPLAEGSCHGSLAGAEGTPVSPVGSSSVGAGNQPPAAAKRKRKHHKHRSKKHRTHKHKRDANTNGRAAK
jgi:hypothetical protein